MASGCKKAGNKKNSPSMKRYNAENRCDVHKERRIKREAKRQDTCKKEGSQRGLGRVQRRKDMSAFRVQQKEHGRLVRRAMEGKPSYIHRPGELVNMNGKKDICNGCQKKKGTCVCAMCYDCTLIVRPIHA